MLEGMLEGGHGFCWGSAKICELYFLQKKKVLAVGEIDFLGRIGCRGMLKKREKHC